MDKAVDGLSGKFMTRRAAEGEKAALKEAVIDFILISTLRELR